jgi:Spy/CpxP family protein refolding chaperone
MAERRAARAAKLHEALKLTAQQEPAWAAFQAAMQPQPRAKVDRETLRALPAPERMAQRVAMSKQRIARMEARQAALANFYAVLSPEQQQAFEAATKRHGHHRGHGMRRG